MVTASYMADITTVIPLTKVIANRARPQFLLVNREPGKMADGMAVNMAPSQMSSQKHIIWPDASMQALIRVSQDNLSALRSNTCNA